MNKSARYFLTPEAVAYLRNTAGMNQPEAIWNSRMHDDRRSPDFIDLQVDIHAAYNSLQKSLGDRAQIKTGLEMYGIEGVIKPMPGLMVEPKAGKHFSVELTDGDHLFLAKKRIRKYIENYDADDWEWDKYPDVYIVRYSAADRAKLRNYVEDRMEDGYLDEDDFSFFVIPDVSKIKV